MPTHKYTVEVIQHPLELNEELHLHEKGWKIQRVGWVLILLVIVAGLAGVFGEGIASKKTQVVGNVTAEYEQFFRFDTEMKISVEAASHISQLSLPQQYLQDFTVIRIVPAPLNNSTANGNVLYNFLPGDNRLLDIYLTPKDYGITKGTLQVKSANSVSSIHLHHFIYP